MKRMKQLLVYIVTTAMVLGVCLPVNTQTALADEVDYDKLIENLYESMTVDPEVLWTDGAYLVDGQNNLWKFYEYLDGRWSMEGKQLLQAYNIIYAGELIRTDGTLFEKDERWPADKKVKWVSYGSNATAVVDDKGNLWVWGETFLGELGCLESDGTVEKPKKIMTNVEKVYLFSAGGCAIKKDGTLWSWGPEGPFITKSHYDATVSGENGWSGFYTTKTTSEPKKVMNNVKDIWSGLEWVVLKTDNSLYVDKKKVDEDVIDVYTTFDYSNYDGDLTAKACQTVVYLKEDGSLWGYGWPYQLGLDKGNTTFTVKGYTRLTPSGTEIIPDKISEYQCVPVKLMENVATIINGEHEAGMQGQFYVLKKDGSVMEIGYKEQKKIKPDGSLNLYYNEDISELSAADQKIKEGIESTTIKAKTSQTSDGKLKLTWTKSKGYAVDYYEVYRSTSKTRAFNKQYSTSKGTQKSYKNTSVKKGTRYYYAVRGVREINGQKYYTQWSNIANRKVQ